MRQSGAETLATEEPDAFIAHVRVCGGLAGQPPALPGSRPPPAATFSHAGVGVWGRRLTASVRRQRPAGKNRKTMAKTGHTILMTVWSASVEW